MQKPTSILKPSFYALSSSVLGFGLTFLLSVLITRVLPMDERGVLTFFQSSVLIISAIAGLGIGRSFAHFIKVEKISVSAAFSRLLSLVGTSSIVMSVLGVVVAGFFLNYEVSAAGLIGLFFYCVSYAIYAQLQLLFSFENTLITVSVSRVLNALFAVVLVFVFYNSLDLGLVVYIYSSSFALVIFYFLARFFLNSKWKKNQVTPSFLDRNFFKTTWKADIVSILGSHSDKIIVAWVLSIEELAVYGVSYTFIRAFNSALNPFANIYFANSYGNSVVAKHRLKFFSLLIILLCFFGILFFALIGEELVVWLFGDQYRDVWILVSILLLEAAMLNIGWLLVQKFIMQNFPQYRLYRGILMQVFMLPIVYLMATKLGVFGAAWGMVITSFFGLCLALYFLRKLA